MEQKFSWKTQAKPILALAPMDGWTDSPCRQIIKEIEPRTLVFTEFVSVDGLTHKNRSKELLQKAIAHQVIEKPLVVQLFGKDPEKFALAAEILEEMGAGAIDINFGCPAKKVVGHNNGAALLKNPDLAREIVRATKQATKLDVSVKTRLGWDNPEQIFSFGEMLLKAGANALTFHGRTAQQGFAGVADYQNIFELKKRFPEAIILGNGDITTCERAREICENLDGVMIGRGAMNNYFIFKEICEPSLKPATLEQKMEALLRHARLAENYRGEHGVIALRKFLAMVVKGFVGAKEYRLELMQVQNYSELEAIFQKLYAKLGE